ncbi:hypothetical protein PG994_005077 [Apiospora phragmitis]|uniref:Uncharacterized protein n=1 Tax=Apiospora phragmitis TaxID=2905665 RepID=A0ABR1VWE9_9PEZI
MSGSSGIMSCQATTRLQTIAPTAFARSSFSSKYSASPAAPIVLVFVLVLARLDYTPFVAGCRIEATRRTYVSVDETASAETKGASVTSDTDTV